MSNTKQRMFDDALASARAITKGAEMAGRQMTGSEREEVEAHLQVASSLKAAITTAKLAGGSTTGLLQAFKSAGWKAGTGEKIYIDDSGTHGKATTFDGSIDDLSPTRREGQFLGYESRYLHTSFRVDPIDPTTTSVQVLRQKERTLADPGPTSGGDSVLRPIDSTDPKAETDSVRELVPVAVQQVATVSTGIPNLFVQSENFAGMVQTDLRLSILQAYDQLIIDAITTADIQTTAPQVDLFASVRYAIEDLAAVGYVANVLAVNPSDAIAMDLYQSQGPEELYQSGVGRFAGPVFGLRTVISPLIDFPLVLDTSAFATLYLSGLSLAQFEENAGATNSSTIRLEGVGACGVERDDAATGIGGS